MAARVLACLAGVLLAVGCGGDGGSEAEQPKKTGTVGDLATYEVSSAGFTIGVPRDWDAVSADEIFSGETLDDFIEENPDFEAYREALSSPDSPFKFIAVDPDVQDDFATNVNVVVSPVPQSVTFEQYREASRAEIEALARDNPVDEQIVTLPAGQAFRLEYDSEFTQSGQARTLATLQYGFLHDSTSYVVTFTTLPRLEGDYADEFDESIRSFRFL